MAVVTHWGKEKVLALEKVGKRVKDDGRQLHRIWQSHTFKSVL